MKIDDILICLRKRKYQARQLSPNAIVVSIERAETAVRNAFKAGADSVRENNKNER